MNENLAYEDDTLRLARPSMLHYHGDTVRILLITAAVLMIVAESMGAALPYTVYGTVIWAVIFVIAAGITNPETTWIHYVNALIVIINAVVFGTRAIEHFQINRSFLDSSYLFAEVLSILFLAAIYFAVKTVRGRILRPHLT